MNQQEILKKIGSIIADLNDQYTYLQQAESPLNELELELFTANANFLSDHIEILQKINGQTLHAAKPAALPEKVYGERQEIPDYFQEDEHLLYVEKISASTQNESLQETDSPEISFVEVKAAEAELPEPVNHPPILLPETMPEQPETEEIVATDTSFSTQKSEPVENDTLETVSEKPSEPKELPEPAQSSTENLPDAETQNASFTIEKPEPATSTAPEADGILPAADLVPQVEAPVQPQISFQPERSSDNIFFSIGNSGSNEIPEIGKTDEPQPLTLNQRIAAQMKGAEPGKKVENTGKPVHDLQSLISLNDKLLFVKDLFNGYNLAYAEAINILNRYNSFEQSEQFLNANYAVKNNWKEKPAAAERFFEIIKKRFS